MDTTTERNRGHVKPVQRLYGFLLIALFFIPGCASNIKNISPDLRPAESVLVGYIETVPVLWEYSLYEEKSGTDDQIEIAGMGYGLTKEGKLQNQGYLFKVIRPGSYILRLQKTIAGRYAYDDILRLEIPEGKLVYFGTVKVVVDEVLLDQSQLRSRTANRAPMMFKYHFVAIDEDETLRQFAKQYPEAYSSYKEKIIRIQAPSRPKQYILRPHPSPLAANIPRTHEDPFLMLP
jgi:hypothetical protein